MREELEKLVEGNIVEWKESENRFRIKSIEEWTVPVNKLWDQQRFEELYALNSRDK